MECGEQYVEWIIVMLLSSVVLLDLMEVSIFLGIYNFCIILNLLQ